MRWLDVVIISLQEDGSILDRYTAEGESGEIPGTRRLRKRRSRRSLSMRGSLRVVRGSTESGGR